MEFFFRPVPEDVARIRAAGVAVAIKRYALVSGILPHRLDTMAPDPLPAVPADPYDGRPLRYRRTDGEYVVYSVGPDGRDDGGDAGKDIAVRVRH